LEQANQKIQMGKYGVATVVSLLVNFEIYCTLAKCAINSPLI